MNLSKVFLMATVLLSASAQAAPTFNWKAYYEGYYMYNLNTPQTTNGNDENSGRLNDSIHNSFTTNLVELSVNGQATQEVGYTVEAGYGDLNDSVYGDDSNRDILNQAYLTLNLPALNNVTIEVGRFYSHMGLERLKASQNWNFSHSLTYKYALPQWHEGARARLINKKDFSLTGYIYNGWNSEDDENDSKTLGLKAQFTPSEKLQLTYNLITGAERGTDESDYRTVHNLIGEYAAASKTALSAEFTLGTEKRAELSDNSNRSSDWMALALSAKHFMSEKAFIAGRLEHFDDENASRFQSGVADVKITSLTATYGYQHSKELMTKVELRHDDADENVIREDANGTDDSQTSFLLGLMYTL